MRSCLLSLLAAAALAAAPAAASARTLLQTGGNGAALGYGGVGSDSGESGVAPTQTQTDAFLGTCAVQAGGEPLSPACAASGPELRDLLAVLSLSPQLWRPNDAAVLASLCASGCLTQLASRFGTYATTLANSSSTQCTAALVPNLAPFAQLLANSLCLSPPQVEEQGSCAPAVALALSNTTLLPLLLDLPPAVGQPLRDGHGGVAALQKASPQLCAALAGTGCCGAAALQALHAAAQMSCRPKLARAIQRLSVACNATLPPACPAFALPSYETVAGCPAARWPDKACPAPPPGACPATACQLACAVVRPGDPASAAAVAAAWPAGKSEQRDPPAAATYITACLEGAAGAPFSPSCSATYPDVQALLAIALNTPSAFSPSDAAALTQLCAPRGGASPCISQLDALADAFLQHARGGHSDSVCDTQLGPNLGVLTDVLLGFACLTSDEKGAGGGESTTTAAEEAQDAPFWAAWGTWGDGREPTWCLPAAAGALAAAGLADLLRAPWAVTAAAVTNSTPALCASLAAGGAGCCGPSALLTLQLGFQALCLGDVAAALGEAVQTCAAPPFLLEGALCPSFHLPRLPHSLPASCAPLALDWTPPSCGLKPGACPATACQMLCAVATNDPPR